jgi:DNA-binding NarL/FixJ family response regulator
VSERIRILIVDDHPLVAEGLGAVLGSEPDIEVVGTARTALEAEEIANRQLPAVVMMDFRLPDRSGAEAAAAIRAEHPEVAVVFLTADASDEVIAAAVQAGAAGFLLKGDAPAAIAGAIRRVAAGEMIIPADVLARLFVAQRQTARTEAERARVVAQFTPRERDVLTLMGEGLDNAEIAERLFVELTTVRWHVRNILEKLGAHSKLAAVLRASEFGLVEHQPSG